MTNDPALIAYAVRRSRNKRLVWTQIGRAFPHEKGAGLTVVLDAMPWDGRIVLLERTEHDDERLQREASLVRKRKSGRPRADSPRA